MVALALLIIWLSDEDDSAPAVGTSTPTPTVAATSSPAPTATPRPTPTPAPSPTPSPTPAATATPGPDGQRPLFRLAVWDGRAWRFDASPGGASYREGEAVPFLLRIEDARPGAAYPLTILYDCQAFALLTSYDRDEGSAPAQARGGPGSAVADSTASIPDDPGTASDDGEAGSLSLWGGLFSGGGDLRPSSACTGEKGLSVGLVAAADTVFLIWAAQLAEGASDSNVPLRLTVQVPGEGDVSIEVDPGSVTPATP